MEGASGALVPVIGVRNRALFTVQVRMDGHAVYGFEFVDQVVGVSPISFCIPPERRKWDG